MQVKKKKKKQENKYIMGPAVYTWQPRKTSHTDSMCASPRIKFIFI